MSAKKKGEASIKEKLDLLAKLEENFQSLVVLGERESSICNSCTWYTIAPKSLNYTSLGKYTYHSTTQVTKY